MDDIFRGLPFPIAEINEGLEIVNGNEAFLELFKIPVDISESLFLAKLFPNDKIIANAQNFKNINSKKINSFFQHGSEQSPVEITFFEFDSNPYLFVYDLKDQVEKNEKYIKLREKMVKGMYQQGIAQSAIGVLHNIGNLLTIIKSNADNEQTLSELTIISSIFRKLEDSLEGDIDKTKVKKLLETINSNYSKKLEIIEKSFETIIETVANMDEVIKTQQKYASVDNKQIEEFSVVDIIQDSLNLNTERIRKRDILVKVNVAEDLKGKFEKSGLIQVCSNLVVNAVESMDERFEIDPNYTQKEISISAFLKGDMIEILIEDNGKGFDPNIKDKLFDFGFSTKERGSGFGLHECQSMLKFYGGSMELSSNGDKKGAISKVLIPAA